LLLNIFVCKVANYSLLMRGSLSISEKMKKIILTIFFAFFIVSISACNAAKSDDKKSSEKYASETRNEFGFREIKAGNAVNLIISVQKEFSITVEGEENLLKDVKTEVKGETLVISTSGKITPSNKVRLKISMPELLNLELWGASEATVTDVKNDSLKLQAGGTSKIKIDGETKSLEVAATGASQIDAENLKTEKTEAKATGASEITVSATNDLTAEAFGASTVYYVGEPKNVKQNVIGTSEVRKK
jgi:Putative auto-transporter adhesin, head GIN domain